MATQRFDELNTLRGYAETWFDKMKVPDEAKKKRVDLAMDFAEIFIMLFAMIENDRVSKERAKAFVAERIKIVADNYVGTENTAYVNDWSRVESERIVEDTYKLKDKTAQEDLEENEDAVESTEKPAEDTPEKSDRKVVHFDEYNVDVPKEEYPTSDFRGLLLGVECSTSVANYYDFYDAVERNGATKKVWISEADGKVRATHDEAHGQERQINKLFVVGDSELMFPGDITHGADLREIINCRCWVSYYSENNEFEKQTEDGIMIQNSEVEGIENQRFYIPKDVGAAFKKFYVEEKKYFLRDKKKYLKPGTYVTGVKVISQGKKIKTVQKLIDKYLLPNGQKTTADDWYKVRGTATVTDGEGHDEVREVHWYQAANIGKVDFKYPTNPKQR